MGDFEHSLLLPRAQKLPRTIADRTRRIYDSVSAIYPASSLLFHKRAHECLLEHLAIRDGMRVLEIATGSGEMFGRLAHHVPAGRIFGLDLAPRMAARTQQRARKKFPQARCHCGAADVRHMPFSSSSFDSVICCYVLELLSADDIRQALREIRRVLRPGAICGLIVVAENGRIFNQLYDTAGMLVPALWGRQVERAVPDLMREAGFQLVGDYLVRQMGYPSRVLIAEKRPLKGANRQSTELPETPA